MIYELTRGGSDSPLGFRFTIFIEGLKGKQHGAHDSGYPATRMAPALRNGHALTTFIIA